MLGHSTLDLSAAVGRYAVAYVRKVCAQAHTGFVETSPGEDVLAVDGVIQYPSIDLRVQIKGSTQPSLAPQSGTLSLAIEDKLRAKWRRNGPPAYLIYVLIEEDVKAWFEYEPTNTLAGAYALWSRIDDLPSTATHVEFDRTRRFTADAVGAWYEGVYVTSYGGGGSGAGTS